MEGYSRNRSMTSATAGWPAGHAEQCGPGVGPDSAVQPAWENNSSAGTQVTVHVRTDTMSRLIVEDVTQKRVRSEHNVKDGRKIVILR